MALETGATLLQAHFVAALPWTKPLWAAVPRLYNKESYQYQTRCDLCKALEHGHWHKGVTQRTDFGCLTLKLPHKPGHELRNGGKCQNTKNSPLRNTTSSKPPAFLPGKAPWNMRVYTNCPLFLVTKLAVRRWKSIVWNLKRCKFRTWRTFAYFYICLNCEGQN